MFVLFCAIFVVVVVVVVLFICFVFCFVCVGKPLILALFATGGSFGLAQCKLTYKKKKNCIDRDQVISKIMSTTDIINE